MSSLFDKATGFLQGQIFFNLDKSSTVELMKKKHCLQLNNIPILTTLVYIAYTRYLGPLVYVQFNTISQLSIMTTLLLINYHHPNTTLHIHTIYVIIWPSFAYLFLFVTHDKLIFRIIDKTKNGNNVCIYNYYKLFLYMCWRTKV